MSFHAEGGAVEGRAVADVGDRTAAVRFAFEERARDVDAAGRQKFLIGGQIQGGKCEAASRSGAADDFTCQQKCTPEEAGGVADVPGGNRLTDCRT